MLEYTHKLVSTMSSWDEFTSSRAETVATEQAAANLNVYIDQRMGELVAALPTKQGKRSDLTSLPVGNKVTKTEALQDAGLTPKTASQLEQLAKNPEVVEAVIAKATEEGRIVSRKQVLDAIKQQKQAEQQRDEARQEMQDVYLQAENMELEVERLKDQLKSRPQREVVREVVPKETQRRISELEKSNKQFSEDYEDLRRRFSSTQTELEQARKELATNESTLASIRDIQALTRAMGEFVGRYSGHTWPFADIDEQTMSECARALRGLSTFVDALKDAIHAKGEN